MHLGEIDSNVWLWTNGVYFHCIQVWCHVWEITYLMPLVICIEICFSTCFTLLDHESWNFFHIITWYLLISIVKTLMGEPWGVWISVLAFFFLGWDMLLISCELWFVIGLGWLGGWKKLLPISFSCSWKLLCYASSYVTQPIRWWFAVLQKEKTSQQSWRWRKNLWWHRYGCWLLSFHGISYSIMSKYWLFFSESHWPKLPRNHDVMIELHAWKSSFLSMVYMSETWMKKNRISSN